MCKLTRTCMRVNKMFSKGKCFDPYANSLNSSLRKYMQIKLENLYLDTGA